LARNILGPQGRSVGIRIRLYILILCLLSLFCSISQANELVNLNLHNEVYAFIKRLRAKNLIENGPYNTQPLTRREATEALIEVSEKYLSGQIETGSSSSSKKETYYSCREQELHGGL
jgi:hypothetical protein